MSTRKFRVEAIGGDLCIEYDPKPDQIAVQYAKALMLFHCGHFCYRGNGDPPICCKCLSAGKPGEKRARCSVCLNRRGDAPDIFQNYAYEDG
jgi:hypothetical protein